MFVPPLKLQYYAMKHLTHLLPTINVCSASGGEQKGTWENTVMKIKRMTSTWDILVVYNSGFPETANANRLWSKQWKEAVDFI